LQLGKGKNGKYRERRKISYQINVLCFETAMDAGKKAQRPGNLIKGSAKANAKKNHSNTHFQQKHDEH